MSDSGSTPASSPVVHSVAATDPGTTLANRIGSVNYHDFPVHVIQLSSTGLDQVDFGSLFRLNKAYRKYKDLTLVSAHVQLLIGAAPDGDYIIAFHEGDDDPSFNECFTQPYFAFVASQVGTPAAPHVLLPAGHPYGTELFLPSKALDPPKLTIRHTATTTGSPGVAIVTAEVRATSLSPGNTF